MGVIRQRQGQAITLGRNLPACPSSPSTGRGRLWILARDPLSWPLLWDLKNSELKPSLWDKPGRLFLEELLGGRSSERSR